MLLTSCDWTSKRCFGLQPGIHMCAIDWCDDRLTELTVCSHTRCSKCTIPVQAENEDFRNLCLHLDSAVIGCHVATSCQTVRQLNSCFAWLSNHIPSI